MFTGCLVMPIRNRLYPLPLLLIVSLLPDGASAQPFQPPTALNTNAATDSGNDSTSHLATDGNGNWVVAWGSDDPLGGTIGTDTDILVSRSTNNGVTWTAPAALNTNAATDAGRDEWVQLSTDGAGTWLAVWTSADTLGNTIGTDDDVLFARSLDAGATWTAPSPLNGQAGSDADTDRAASVATDGAGNWVAVWVSRDTLGGTIGGDQDIVFARSTDSGATWSAPAALNSNAAVDHAFADDEEPSVVTDGAGNWVAIWDGPQEITVSRSTDAGVSWSPLAQIPHPFATTRSNWWPPHGSHKDELSFYLTEGS